MVATTQPQGDEAGKQAPTLQTVERALSFLEIVSATSTPMTVRDASEALGLNITTCYHLFNTLQSRHYIERNPDLTLRVGPQITKLFEGYRRGFSTQQQTIDLVDQLSRDTSETAHISMYTQNSVVLTAFTEGQQPLRASGLYIGLSGAEHLRASGKAVLAHLDPDARELLIERALTASPPEEHTQIRHDLNDELNIILDRGWAFDDQVYQVGLAAIAAPFFSRNGDVLGSLGVWAPAGRFYKHQDRLVEQLLEAAREATSLFSLAP